MSEHLPMPDGLLERVAQQFKLLSEPSRLRILQLLLEGEKTVGELVAAMETTQANITHQLGLLSAGGLVAKERAGMHVYYRINDPSLTQLNELVCSSLKEQGEADLQQLRIGN